MCDIEIDYDKYIEAMKEKALSLADDLQSSWDKPGFWIGFNFIAEIYCLPALIAPYY